MSRLEPSADDRTGYCPIGDITYCGPEQPIVHGDETLDPEEYALSVCEFADNAWGGE